MIIVQDSTCAPVLERILIRIPFLITGEKLLILKTRNLLRSAKPWYNKIDNSPSAIRRKKMSERYMLQSLSQKEARKYILLKQGLCGEGQGKASVSAVGISGGCAGLLPGGGGRHGGAALGPGRRRGVPQGQDLRAGGHDPADFRNPSSDPVPVPPEAPCAKRDRKIGILKNFKKFAKNTCIYARNII